MGAVLRLLAAAAALALAALAALAIWFTFFLDLDRHRERIAAALSAATGAQVTIAGALTHEGLSPLRLTAADVRVTGPADGVAELSRVEVALSPLALASGVLRLDTVRVRAGRLGIRRLRDGRINLAPALTAATPGTGFIRNLRIGELSVAAARADIVDDRRELALQLGDARFTARNLPIFLGGRSVLAQPGLLREHAFGITATSERARTHGHTAHALSLRLRHRPGEIRIEHARGRIARDDGSTVADFEGSARLRVPDASSAKGSSPQPPRLQDLDLTIDELAVEAGGHPLTLTDSHLASSALPLPVHLPAPANAGKWVLDALLQGRLALVAEGERGAYAGYTARGFRLSVPASDERPLELAADRFAGQTLGHTWEAGLTLTARAAATGEPVSGPAALPRTSVAVTATDVRVRDPAGRRWRSDRLQLTGEELRPLATDRASPELPTLLAGLRPPARLALTAHRLRTDARRLDRLTLELAGEADHVALPRIELALGESTVAGDGELRVEDGRVAWRLRLAGDAVGIGALADALGHAPEATGTLSIDADLGAPTLRPAAAVKGLDGHLRLGGRDITIRGINADAVLTRLLETPEVGLLDIGALALLGPYGPLVTTATSYARLANSLDAAGDTRLRETHTELAVRDGVVRLRDTAFATERHRVAVKGTIDLPDAGRLDLRFGIVDGQGCARYIEEIGGTLADPSVSEAGLVVEGVIEPIESLAGDIADLFGERCGQAFYSGRVGPPPAPRPTEGTDTGSSDFPTARGE